MEILHFYHDLHPLVLTEDKMMIIDQLRCGICRRFILAVPFYSCKVCKYYVHQSCAELPHYINDHYLHRSHSHLSLLIHANYWCSCCNQLFEDAPTFSCDECGFQVDVDCAMMPNFKTACNVKGQQHCIQHVDTHPHALLLVDPDDYKDIKIECFACKLESSSGGGVYYGCERCKYFLHESCVVQSPKEIQHSLHPHHGLLALVWRLNFSCKLCGTVDSFAYTFECRQCRFQLCVKCGTTNRIATIKHKDHDHLLCFIDEKGTKLIGRCNIIDSYCKQAIFFNSDEFNHTSCFMLRCLECDFKVHLLCGLLPFKIKHECHIHPLIFIDSLIEDFSGEYYCDICETARDPQFQVYYCEQCKYIAHVHCVIFEIIKVLTTYGSDVELKTKGEDLWKFPQEKGINVRVIEEGQGESPLTLKDLIHKLTEDDQRILRIYYKWDDHDMSSKDKKAQVEEYNHDVINAQFELGEEDINEILEISHLTFEDYTKKLDAILNDFWLRTKLELKFDDLELKIVNVDGYMIPNTLVPVFKKLLHKYGDISSGSPRTQTLKSITFCILCLVLKRMCSTRVIDISKKHLQEWSYHIFFAHQGRFEVDFAISHVRKLGRVFFGFQANRLEDEIPKRLEEKIIHLKETLKKCKEYSSGSSSKSEFLKHCFKEGSELKWKNACEGSLG